MGNNSTIFFNLHCISKCERVANGLAFSFANLFKFLISKVSEKAYNSI